ncbi:MAG: menaquinone biosynthesis decarboxylase [Armatimonadetes bacterium]|nr:menaquinone biosynthesis decarboxylase [Armatimonadota bacterium]
MAYNGLTDFIAHLERENELVRVPESISRDLEITEIADRVMKSQGPALLFGNVEGFDMPVLINAYGSYRRMAMALGVGEIEEIARRIESLLHTDSPSTFAEKLMMLPKLIQLSSAFPKTVKNAPCQEIVRTGTDADLNTLPILQCWPSDGGRFITLPMVFTRSLETGKRNVGMYRMHVYDSQTTGMHWHLHKVGARHYAEHEAAGKRMEVAVALGGDPAITYAATAPLPDDFDEMLFAGFLRGCPVEMVQCKTIDQQVPADAEIVLEGYVDPKERRTEGPFGDHTGYYSPADEYPVFHLTCITQRSKPIYPATIVGRPPMEDCYLGKATERIFLPLIKSQLPEIVDMNLPIEGIFHNLAFISIRKRYPLQAHKVISALWGLGQMMFTKIIAVFDEDVDVQNISDVLWRLGSNIDPRRDIIFADGPVDVLDHAAGQPLFGSKMGIDATRKIAGEGYNRAWPDDIKMSDEIISRIDNIWRDLGIGC